MVTKGLVVALVFAAWGIYVMVRAWRRDIWRCFDGEELVPAWLVFSAGVAVTLVSLSCAAWFIWAALLSRQT